MNIIDRFKIVHDDKYDYSNIKYINSRTKVDIICFKHGIFRQLPHHHLSGQGCKKCYQYSNTDEFINKSLKIHNHLYDYSKVEYQSSNKKVKIICKIHGEFNQTPNSHLDGHGCPDCGNTKKISSNRFIDKSNKLHNNNYNYSKVIYKNIHTKVKIICKIHGEFNQTPNSHLNGSGCPDCSLKFGKMENKWLDSVGIKDRQINIQGYIVDGYDNKTKTIYEFYGDYWHGNPDVYNPEDINRNNKIKFGTLFNNTIKREEKLKKLGYNIIHIWENDYKKNKLTNDTI